MKGNITMKGANNRNRRKNNRLLGILACIAGLLAVAGIIFFGVSKAKNKGFFTQESETDYVAYDFSEVTLEEYSAPLGGAGDLGEVTRYRVTIVANPSNDAGTVTRSQYVTKGGSLTVEVKNVNDGYEFDGWYIDGTRVSQDTSYYIVGVTSDMTVIAKFSVDMIDITTNAVVSDNGFNFNGGGILLGGGSLYKGSGDSINITAIPGDGGFVFDCFVVNGTEYKGNGDDNPVLKVVAGPEPGGTHDDTVYVESDTVVTAKFIKSSQQRMITASMVPAAGGLSFDFDTSTPKAPYICMLDNNSDSLQISWTVPETTVQVTGSDGKPVDKYRYEMDCMQVKQNGSTYHNVGIVSDALTGSFVLDGGREIPTTGDFDIFVLLKPALAQDQGTFCASTVSVPAEGGLTSGGGSSTLVATYNLKATPNVGYRFDHWEWCENGVYNSSNKAEIFVTPPGYVTYKAFFVPAYYNISLASSDPAEGGSVTGLGNIKADATGNASTTLTVKPTSGYKLDSGTYVMGGSSYVINFTYDESTGLYSIPINNITDDVALNLKYKRDTTSTATVTLWDDSREEGYNKVGFATASLDKLSASTSVTLTSSSTSTAPSGTVTIYAKEEGPYKFKQWISSNGNIIPAGTGTDGLYSTEVTVTGDVSYYAQFVQENYTIEVEADPAKNKDDSDNIVKIYDDGTGTGTPVDKGNKDASVPSGSSRRLVAIPATGKHFLYWTNSAGTKFSGVTDTSSETHSNSLVIKNINWSDKYTAHFVEDHLEVGVDVSDPDAGTAQLNDKAPVSIYTTYNDIPYEETIHLKAKPNPGYRFVRWDIITYNGSVQENKASFGEPSISLVYINQDVDCIAVFEKGDYTIKVVSSPVAGGKATVNGMNDQAEVDEGAKAVLEATANDGYSFDYWTDSAGNRYTDNPYTIDSVNGNDTFTAHFKSPQLKVTIQPSKDGAGTVQLDSNPAVSTKTVYGDIANGSTVSLKAVPANGYKFVRWEAYSEASNRTAAYGEATTVIADLKEDTTFTAIFSDSSYTIKVLSNPIGGGTAYVNGKLDSADFMPGESATLEAEPASGYKFEYWTDSAGNRYSQNPCVIPSVQGNDTFTAHFVQGNLEITLNCTPQEAGVLKFNGTAVTPGVANVVEAGANATLTAEPKKGYTFIRWESLGESGQNPVAYADKEIQIFNITQSETYTAIFAKDSYTIKVVSSPIAGGSVTADDKTDEAVYAPGDSATLVATPSQGYRFSFWTDSAGNKYSDNPYVISNVQGNDTFTAHFVLGKIAITLDSSPAGAGVLRLDGEKVTAGEANEVESGANLILNAEPKSGYKFVRWESKGESGQTPIAYADREIQVLNVTQSETYTAIFSEDVYTIKVVSSPIAGGTTTANGRIDEAYYAPGDKAVLKAVPSNGYRFDYWTDSAGKRYTENPYVISKVEGNDTFTAHYVMGKLSITLDAVPSEAGVVKLNGRVVNNGSTHEVESGSNITLTAEVTDESRYQFERWESAKGTVSTTNPLQIVNITEADTYTAVFNIKTGKHGIKVIASPASGGQATKTISRDGKSAELRAIARPGYKFVEWRKEEVVISRDPICTVTDLKDGTTYTAVFIKTHDVDVRSDIIREHFYNDKRIFTTPSYSITRGTMEANAKLRIEEARGNHYNNSTPGLKNYKAVSDAEGIFDDIELLEDRTVVMTDGELITTDGEIMSITNVDDYSKEDSAAKDFTLEKYGKRYAYEIVNCKDVRVPEGYEDGTRTYIWKNQRVQKGDNIYILYELNGGKMDCVSCTVDEEDSIKFTIDSIGTGARMTIVKVIIE